MKNQTPKKAYLVEFYDPQRDVWEIQGVWIDEYESARDFAEIWSKESGGLMGDGWKYRVMSADLTNWKKPFEIECR
ncbi:MAG: hypothetical protein ISN29_09725 [Gammaproteobacteria bacterium AqS3]|nr:hypothetical protein [Gammaproteobacteria bacterium AqS3]